MSDAVFTRVVHEDNRTIITRGQEVDGILKSIKPLRFDGTAPRQDLWHVGRVPFVVMEMWCTEAGIEMSDKGAVQEVIRKKLLDGEFQKLRVREGTF